MPFSTASADWPPSLEIVIVGAGEQFADHVAREHLLNAVGLRLVHKDGHGDGAHARGHARGMAGGVIAAASKHGDDAPAEKMAARASLDFSMRPDGGQRGGAVGGGKRGQAKIIDGGPEPEAIFMDRHHGAPPP